MEISELLKYLSLLIAASTKFVVALGYMLLPNTHYNYLEIVLVLLVGGSIGILFFYFLSNWINLFINMLFKKGKEQAVFSKKSRKFINIKNKYGLIGISLLTPIFFSIPLGSFLASRFFYKNKYTIIIMLAGVLFWSFVLPLIRLIY